MVKVGRATSVTLAMGAYLGYAVFWLGWFNTKPEPPWLSVGDPRQLRMVIVLSMPLAAPMVLRWMIGRLGLKQSAFSLLPLAALATTAYFVGSCRYYHGTLRPFDPFVQTAALAPIIPERRSTAYRILTLGGSTTLSEDKAAEYNYPWKLERRLNARRDGPSVEIINGGKDWYTTRHSLINYTSYYRRWEPDLVIVMHAINDLYRSFTPAEFSLGPYNELYTHFYGPAIHGARPPSFEEELFWHRLRPARLEWFGGLRTRVVEMPVERFQSLRAYERNLRALVQYIHADQARAILVSQPSLYRDVLDEPESQALWMNRAFCVAELSFTRREVPSTKSLARAMKAFNDVARRIASETGAGFVDADAAISKDLTMFEDDVHYTDTGSARLAEVIAQELLASRVLSARRTTPQ
jgi:lysophospholipase L1-like esterase